MLKKGENKDKQKLYLIPQAVVYKNSHEPLLSQQKKQTIQQKLKLEKEAILHTRQRENEGEYYFKYNYNPFLELKGIDSKILLKRNKQSVSNIVQKVNEVQTSEIPVRQSTQTLTIRLTTLKTQNQNFSQKLLNNIQKALQVPTQPSHPFKAPTRSPPPPDTYIPPDQKDQHYFSMQQIETIAALREENYHVHNNKINIFRIAKGDDDQISGKEILASRYHFCFNSVVEKIAKIKLPVYRDMSTLGREVATDQLTKQNVIDYVDSYELSYKVKELLFQDILSLASNRLSADFLNRIINFQQIPTTKDDDNSSLQDQSQTPIYYRHNQQNIDLNFINQNEQQQQINDYKALTANSEEVRHEKKYIKEKTNVEKQLELKKDLRSNTVKDQQLHEELSKGIERSLERLVGYDISRVDVDRVVRANKIMKNRNQGIKLKNLLETLAYKNKYQEQFQPNQGRKTNVKRNK